MPRLEDLFPVITNGPLGLPSPPIPGGLAGELDEKELGVGLATTRWEPVTRLAERWQHSFIVPVVENQGYSYYAHDTPLSHKPSFRGVCSQSDIITGVGHGGKDIYTGDFFSPLLEKSEYPERIVKGKMFLLLSCLTGAELGPDTIRKGGAGYHGYYKSYSFCHEQRYEGRPESDPVLRLFFLPWVRKVGSFLRGDTNKEAWRVEWEGYVENARNADDAQIRDLLLREASILEYQGDPEARIENGKIVYEEYKNPEGEGENPPRVEGEVEEEQEAQWAEMIDLATEEKFKAASEKLSDLLADYPEMYRGRNIAIPKVDVIPSRTPVSRLPYHLEMQTDFGKEYIKVLQDIKEIRY